MCSIMIISVLFFFNDPPTPEISTLSLHDALPISAHVALGSALNLLGGQPAAAAVQWLKAASHARTEDRKSTRLNSSHITISYAVFCLKKKKKKKNKTYHKN